tara:strand:- start:550 stop:1140 length:591 start_codon:yes stop_codon:yes gene_type:complete
MSTIEVNSIQPLSSGTTITLGASGKTLNIPSGCTISNSGTASGFGKILSMNAYQYIGQTTASSTSFVDVLEQTGISVVGQNSKFLIEILGGGIYNGGDKYMGFRCQIKEDSGSYSVIQNSNNRDFGSLYGSSTVVSGATAWSYYYTPTNTSSLSTLSIKFQIASINTSGNVQFGYHDFAGAGVDGNMTFKVMEVSA